MSITNAGECPSLTPFLRRLKGHSLNMKKSMDDFFVNLLGYFTDVNQVLTSQKCFHLNYDLFKNLIFDQFRRKIQAKFLKNQELALSQKIVLKLSWLRKQTWSGMVFYNMICIFVSIRTNITKISRIIDFRDFPLFQIFAQFLKMFFPAD